MYSRKLQTLDFRNTESALRALLKQLNVVQEESTREFNKCKIEIEALSQENDMIRAELKKLNDRVKALEEGK